MGKWFAGLSNGLFWLIIILLGAPCYFIRLITDAEFGDLWIVYCEAALVTPLVAIIYYMPKRFAFLQATIFKILGDLSFSLYHTYFLLVILLLNAVIEVFGASGFSALIFCVASLVMPVLIACICCQRVDLKGIKFGETCRRKVKPAGEIA